MGQKVNPISNRLGIIKGWDSNWYGGRNYSEKLVEDYKIREYLTARLSKASISKIVIERTLKLITVTVNTARPGIIIGKGGQEVDKLKEELRKITNKEVQINIFEVKRPELDATIVSNNLARQIEGKISYRRAIKMTIASTMRMGLSQVGVWLGRAGRALILDRSAYGEVRDDPYMTGPAVLIVLVSVLLYTLVTNPPVAWQYFLSRLVTWILSALVLFGAGRLLGSKVELPAVVRSLGFAQVASFLILIGLIPGVAPLARLIAFLVAFLTTWMGAAIGLKLSGWKTLILPVLAILVLVVGLVLLNFLFVGAAFTLNTLATEVGILP